MRVARGSGVAGRAAMVGAAALAVAACTGVPVRTMAKLAMAGSDEFLGADPRDGRHWLVWRLAEPGVRDFREMQAALKAMQAKDESGSLAITVRQDWIGDGWPALKQDRIETWVRTRSADGYFELRSGRVESAARERT